MSGHDVLTLSLSVGFLVVFLILSAMVVHAIRSLSKAGPVTANQAPVPLRVVPPSAPSPRPTRRRKDRGEVELLPADATVTFAAERTEADIDDVFEALDRDLIGLVPVKQKVLDRAMGGVLFIDEACSLYRASDSKDYGQEVVDILLQVMENDRDKLV
jgi:hypothetical protein